MKLVLKYFYESVKSFPYHYLITFFYTVICSLVIAIIPFGLKKIIHLIQLNNLSLFFLF